MHCTGGLDKRPVAQPVIGGVIPGTIAMQPGSRRSFVSSFILVVAAKIFPELSLIHI